MLLAPQVGNQLLERERVKQFYAQALHVAHVTRHKDQIIYFRSGGYQRVYGGAGGACARACGERLTDLRKAS